MNLVFSGFGTIALTGFGIAFLHAAIPTHWLPFVMASRANSWSRAETLSVTGVAGLGHVSLTAVLGALVVWFGLKGDRWLGVYFPTVIASILAVFGFYFLYRHFSHKGHHHLFGAHDHSGDGHHHAHSDHGHGHGHGKHTHHHEEPINSASLQFSAVTKTENEVPQSARSLAIPKSATVLGLIALLTFSPCEGFIPVYLAGYKYGWAGFVILSLVLGLATVVGMLIFTFLTLHGMKFVKLEKIEKYEQGVMGIAFVLLGVAVYVFERS